MNSYLRNASANLEVSKDGMIYSLCLPVGAHYDEVYAVMDEFKEHIDKMKEHAEQKAKEELEKKENEEEKESD